MNPPSLAQTAPGLGRKERDTNVKRVKDQRISIPGEFYKMHNRVTIMDDVMFVSGVPFLVTLSRKIRFRTTQFLPKRTARTLEDSLTKAIMLYARGGFIVNLALMDK